MAKILPLKNPQFADKTPVVIVSGLPRSGTSMMMQMLVAGGIAPIWDGVREADVDNPHGYYEFEQVKRTKQDPSWLIGSEGKVVKMVHVLLHDLPTDRPYRVIMMRRRIEAVLKSQTAMLNRLGEEGADVPQDKLARVFEGQMEEALLMLSKTPCFEVMQVWYGMVIEHTQSQAERINQFLSGELNVEAMVAAVDPSLRRQRA